MTRHPKIHCDYELFHELEIYADGPCPFSLEERDKDQWQFLDTVMGWSKQRYPKKKIYGFKLFFDHSQAVYDQIIEDISWRKIILRRSNILDQFTSEQLAFASNRWHSDAGQNKPTPSKVDIDLDEFDRYRQYIARRYQRAEDSLIASGQDYLMLDYEDVAAGHFDKACRFLCVSASKQVKTHLKKQNPLKSADKIANAAEVRQWLQDKNLSQWWVD